MNKLVKIVLIVAGIFATVFITAAIILVLAVDPNEYKEEISQAVKDETGRELHFEGDINFNFFPWLGLKVGPMALGNAQGFSPNEMVRINKAEASIQILPLLSGEIVLGVIVLDGLTLDLAKNSNGVTNWDDLAKINNSQPESSKSDRDSKSGGQMEVLTMEGIEITNANITFNDQQAGKKTSLTNLNLEIGAMGNKTKFPFKLVFDLKLDDPKIDTRPELTGFAQFDLNAGTFNVEEMVFNVLGIKITGLFFAKSKNEKLNFSGELKLAETSVKKLMAQLNTEPPVTTDPKVLKKISADIKYYGTANSTSLEEMTLKLDDTTIEASGAVNNFDKPAISFLITVDEIDLDRYLPPKAASKEKKTKSTQTANTTPATEPNLSALKDLDLTGELTIGKLKAMNLHITEILCKARAKNGIATIKPFSAKLYEGSLNGQSVLDANHKIATWKENATLKGVQAGPLLKDLTGKDRLNGTTVVNYDIQGQGLTPDNIKKSLTGTASFAFTDGAISGVNIAKMLRDTFNKLKGKPASPAEPEKTDFAELLGSAVIKNGHITNNDLLMKSPLLRVTGKGWANLPKNSVDYTAIVTIVGTLKGQDGTSIEELKGLPLPIKAKGNLDNPDIGLDGKAMAKALLKGTFKDGTKKLEDKLRKGILGAGTKKTGTTKSTDNKKKSGGFLKGLIKK